MGEKSSFIPMKNAGELIFGTTRIEETFHDGKAQDTINIPSPASRNSARGPAPLGVGERRVSTGRTVKKTRPLLLLLLLRLLLPLRNSISEQFGNGCHTAPRRARCGGRTHHSASVYRLSTRSRPGTASTPMLCISGCCGEYVQKLPELPTPLF